MFFLLFVLILPATNAQLQDLQIHSAREYYTIKIKQIDEFFDRFNFDTTRMESFLDLYNSDSIPQHLSREEILTTLFNQKDTTWKEETIKGFINDITNKLNPQFINFYDNDWYAEVSCIFSYKGKEYPVSLILKNQRTGYNESYWVITGLKADFLLSPESINPDLFLNPSVHGTNFMILSETIKENTNIKSFLPIGYKQDILSVFEHEVYSGDLKFLKREKITYHFLDLEGWIFTVEYYNRPVFNSGWLISDLIRADLNQKKKYRSIVLNLR